MVSCQTYAPGKHRCICCVTSPHSGSTDGSSLRSVATPSAHPPHATPDTDCVYYISDKQLANCCTPSTERGKPYPLNPLKNKVVLVVNTASKCGFTPQFEALEKLYKEVASSHPNDFLVLGFPCNQFGNQDPGTNDEIVEFCSVNYGVSFPVLGKIDVNGSHADPLWEWMKAEQPGMLGLKRIKWNFEKFLIGRDGKVKGRWASTTKPESLKSVILGELEKKRPTTTSTAATPTKS